MSDGLGTLGDVLTEAIAKQAPVQKWDCGNAEHQHVKKDEAQKCMATAPPAADVTQKADPVATAEPPTKKPIEKALSDVGRVASIILELDWLKDDLEWEAEVEGDGSPAAGPARRSHRGALRFPECVCRRGETSEVLADSEIDEDDMAMMMASRPPLMIEALTKLFLRHEIRRGNRQGRGRRILRPTAC